LPSNESGARSCHRVQPRRTLIRLARVGISGPGKKQGRCVCRPGTPGGSGRQEEARKMCMPSPELEPRGHRANRQCIFRAGNPVSRHLMVHLKGKGNRHSWPDKVAVPHAWCRKGRSLGSCLSTGADDRPHCSIGREFTANSPELLRSGRLGVLTPGLASGDTRCAATISRHCTIRWRSAAKPGQLRQDRSS
jgi:hypothetical protein